MLNGGRDILLTFSMMSYVVTSVHLSGLQHSNNVSWDIQTPKNLVPETDHTYISLNGDLLGNTIEVVIVKLSFRINQMSLFSF